MAVHPQIAGLRLLLSTSSPRWSSEDGVRPPTREPPAAAVPTAEQLSEEELDDLLPALFGFAVTVAGDREVAEDVVVEVTARTLVHLRRGRIDNLAVYLRRAVVNEMTSLGRRRQLERRQRHHGSVTLARDVPPGESSVDDRLALTPLLLTLPLRQRAVLVLRFMEDRSIEYVAELLELSPGSVKTHTSRGLDRLRQLMEDDDGRR